jgi:glycosyltransferase involved in cell wall biosynthesis
MPAYNAERYVADAIASILGQTFQDFELIVIDDASTDSTWEIITRHAGLDPRLKPLRNSSNLKIAKTLNRGIEMARGRYVARMDADDWSYPDRLEKQYEFMESRPEIVLSGGTIEVCDDALSCINRRQYPKADAEIREKIFFYSPFCHPAIICRTDMLRRADGYNESLEVAQDYDLYFRMGRLGVLANMSDCIHKLRTHGMSSSISRSKLQERNTLYIRLKAVVEYGYEIGRRGRLYLALQYLSSFVVPFRFKFWLFNLLRRAR